MKNLLEDAKNDLLPKVKSVLDKGQKFFLKFINRVDYNLTKTLEVLREKQSQLKQYFIERDDLLKQMERKEKEVDYLKNQMELLRSNSQTKELDELRKELNVKLDDLLKTQKTYFELENKIVEEQEKVNKLTTTKQKLEKERNVIKSKYDQLKVTIEENVSQKESLQREIDELREKEVHYEKLLQGSISNEDKIEYENTLVKLKSESEAKSIELAKRIQRYNQLKGEYKDLERTLLSKVSEISQLNTSLNKIGRELEKANTDKKYYRDELHSKEESLNGSKQKIVQLQEKIEQLKMVERQYTEQYNLAVSEADALRQKWKQDEKGFYMIMDDYEDKIQRLKNELLDHQNELAIARAEHAEPEELNKEEKEILEREFQPRFSTLYKNCFFHEEFFRDFFHVTPSDRLKIESIIALLNNNYDQVVSNIRKNSIKTNSEIILEYPFQTDSAGRIYLNKKNNLIYFYRISRTKNGKGKLTQANVIEWLKRNY